MLIPLPLIHSFRNFDLISAITFSAALSWRLYGGIVMQGIPLFVINFVDSLLVWTDQLSKSIHEKKDSSSSSFKLVQTSSINQTNSFVFIESLDGIIPSIFVDDSAILKLITQESGLTDIVAGKPRGL